MRTLACEERLRVLSHLVTQGEQPPSKIARKLDLLDTALSGHLAKLTAVGMIQRRRSGGWSYCAATSPYAATTLSGMISAWLRKLLTSPAKTVKDLELQEVRDLAAQDIPGHLHRIIFDAVTAFTDVRRLQILRRLLLSGEANIEMLCRDLNMSFAAAHRQTGKLVRRGYVSRESTGEQAFFRLAKKFKTPVHADLWDIIRKSWKRERSRSS